MEQRSRATNRIDHLIPFWVGDTLLIVATTLCAVSAAGCAPQLKEHGSLLGSWRAESSLQGSEDTSYQNRGLTYVFMADGNYECRDKDGKPIDKGSFTSDSNKNPAEIDMQSLGGPGTKRLGIYKIDNDRLILCISTDGKRRIKFETDGNTAIVLSVLKRKS